MRTSSNDFLDKDFKEKSIQEINKMLEEELKKPVKKRNYDKIEELETKIELFRQELPSKLQDLVVAELKKLAIS